ncbi:MAG TPA: Ig-like domain repeat protein [Acidobacteriaceae bacterium]
MSASPNPAVQGSNVVLTATVTSSGGTPVGSLTFLDGTTSLGPATLSNGSASITTSALSVGSHTITASYAGSNPFLASASTAVAVTINAPTVATTTVVSASPNPASAGASVVLTATTTATSGTPTGNVTFFDGATSLGTGTLNGSGVATLTVSTLAVGSHSITANYAGAGSFTASTSSAVALAISAVTTTTSLTVSPNPAAVGANVVLTATTTAASGTATGTVTFDDGTTSLGTGALNGSGVATLAVSTLTGGSHSLTASYAASGSFGASTSAAVALLINQTTTTVVTAAPNPAAQGVSVVLSATTTATSGTPSGSVTFYDGATSVGAGTLNGFGTATLSVSSLAVGSHSITASYTATSGFLASTSVAVTLVINAPQVTTTALSASPNPASAGANVVLTASTTAASGTPTGTVTFYDGTTSLGTASLSGGTATLTVTTLTLGTHSLTASYAGGTGFAASASTAVSVNVTVSVSAHGTFSFTTPNQTIMGFGGAEAFYQNFLSIHPNAPQIYTALFDPVQGLGLNFLRLQNYYYQVGSGYTASNFDPDSPKIVQGANAAAGASNPVSILLAAWSPPASIKSNNNINNGGTLKTLSGGGYDYADYGAFWYNSVLAYEALGVTPNYVSIQNEPDFTATTYASCRFNPTEASFQGQLNAGYDKALDAAYKALQALPTPPKMIGPESFSTVNLLSYANALETETPQNTEIYALAHHLYNVSSTSSNPDSGLSALQNLEAQYPTQLKFETEYYDSPGFLTAWNIHNALAVGNDNAYIYWGLAWPNSQTDQQGLLYIDSPYTPSSWTFPSGWAYNDAYYAMKHFSYFIRPGYMRYNASVDNTDERVSVYQSPDKKTTVIVAMNVSTTATDTMSLDLSGVPYTNSAMYRSTFSQPISTGERWNTLGPVTPTSITLGPQAVVTIVLSK